MEYYLLEDAMKDWQRGDGLEGWFARQSADDRIKVINEACELLSKIEASFQAARLRVIGDDSLSNWLIDNYAPMTAVYTVTGHG